MNYVKKRRKGNWEKDGKKERNQKKETEDLILLKV